MLYQIETQAGRQQLAAELRQKIDDFSVASLSDGPRSHLGASEIGHKCDRYLWYKFRWMVQEKFSGRMLRLFNRGHREEGWLSSLLEGAGLTVHLMNGEGKQFRATGVDGHFSGSCDGVITQEAGQSYLVEFKTKGTGKGFNDMKTDGVKSANPMHYAQCCVYGFKFGLKYVIYLVTNKNDDDLHLEVEALDWEYGAQLESKAERIIYATEAPPRIHENSAHFECKYCPSVKVCHGAEPERNCRSCRNAMPTTGARWGCGMFDQFIPKEFIPTGCDSWQPIPNQDNAS